MSFTNRARRIARAVLETLEDRRLMAATVTLNGGELLVEGGAADANLRVHVTGGRETIRVAVAGKPARAFARGDVGSIHLVGTAGDDVLRVGRSIEVPAHVHGLGGDDRIAGGAAGDTLDGGAGDDTLAGRGGDDRMTGGEGKDRLAGGAGTDELVAVDEADTGRGVGRARRDASEMAPPAVIAPAPMTEPMPAPAEDAVAPDTQIDRDPEGEADLEPQPAPASSEPQVTPLPDSGTETRFDSEPLPEPAEANANAPSPEAVIKFTTSASGMAGHTVHVNALSSQLRTGDALGARYEWDFGDAGARFKKLVGWNAAHTYDRPGTYVVTLKVTNSAGKVDTASGRVTVAADTRRTLYVDAAKGADSNNGTSADREFRTLKRAARSLGDNTKLLVKNGQTHDVKNSVRIAGRNVTLGAYGSGAKARVRKVAGGSAVIVGIDNAAQNVVVENIEFDSVWGLSSSYGTKKVPARALFVGGRNVTIRNNVFRNLTDGVSAEGKPVGLLVQDNLFTAEIRGYGIWSEGTDHVYLANTMRDSKQEHLIRAHGDGEGTVRLLVSHNDLNRSSQSKGSIELRHARWFYVANNRMTGGTLRAGLPTERFQLAKPGWKNEITHWGVMENNVTQRLFINVRAGVQHLAIRNNVIRVDDWRPVLDGNAILVQATADGFDHVRKTDDVRIEYNTVINNDDRSGNFLLVNGHATNLVVSRNLYVAPRINGGSGQGGIVVNDPGRGLSAFRTIGQNVWPATSGNLNYVAGAGYVSASKWESYSQVSGDVYRDVNLSNGDYNVTVGNVVAGSSVTAGV